MCIGDSGLISLSLKFFFSERWHNTLKASQSNRRQHQHPTPQRTRALPGLQDEDRCDPDFGHGYRYSGEYQ
ncbi:hypothetical protein RRG08_012814 [Elysia crispata]|uniref:Uncharacterized protein n=1 Tax=Elysia crispata TaxID=231223 RepID=A0AAE1CPU7_9GAST|nr:hypothetical protein RRG08_012814 [Elysia crispata]